MDFRVKLRYLPGRPSTKFYKSKRVLDEILHYDNQDSPIKIFTDNNALIGEVSSVEFLGNGDSILVNCPEIIINGFLYPEANYLYNQKLVVFDKFISSDILTCKIFDIKNYPSSIVIYLNEFTKSVMSWTRIGWFPIFGHNCMSTIEEKYSKIKEYTKSHKVKYGEAFIDKVLKVIYDDGVTCDYLSYSNDEIKALFNDVERLFEDDFK